MTDTTQMEAAVTAAQARQKANKLVIFTWGGDLDKVWPTLILAASAAAIVSMAIAAAEVARISVGQTLSRAPPQVKITSLLVFCLAWPAARAASSCWVSVIGLIPSG